MQIFPSFEAVDKPAGNRLFDLDANYLGRSDADFINIFNSFMQSKDADAPFQDALPDPPRVRSDHAKTGLVSVYDDPPASVHQKNMPANKEDFTQLRKKLEQLGVDKDVLDRVEELFDRADTVTWGQVYEVLREPLEKKTHIKLSALQQQDVISLFNKMGFTPQEAKALLGDILDNKYDAVWRKVQDMLSSLTNGQSIPATAREIASLLKALGLDLPDLVKSGLKKITPEAQAMLQKIMSEQKLSPELQSAMQAVLAAAKGEAKPNAETLSAMQKIVAAALKGTIKLDQNTLDALKTALQNAAPGVNLEQFLNRLSGDALSPKEMRNILAMIKDAVMTNNQSNQANKGEILSEIHKAMAGAEIKAQHMAQTNRMDGDPGTSRLGQSDIMKTINNTVGRDNGSAGGSAGEQNPARNPQSGDKNAQGWNSFWDKINVKNTVKNAPEGAGTIIKDVGKDIGADTRPAAGQPAAIAAEAAARRIINNAPAPHRTVLQQIHSGLLQNMGQGRQQLTLQLNPPELGSLTVNLRVFGKEVHAVLRAENQDARQLIAENLPLLRQSLETQGLKVSRLEVQAQLQEQNQFTQLWQGMDGRKFQDQDAKTQWGALGRGQTRTGTSGPGDASGLEQSVIEYRTGRKGGINLIA